MSTPEAQHDGFPRPLGKYHLLCPLAQGGMGALYLAVSGDSGLERLLVIKTVLPHLADDEYLARFRDEAKIVVKLSHGNLVPVFDAGQVGGELFLAMDFVEGKDLRAVWNRCAKKQVAFPVDVAVHIVKELCRGLDYAHSFEDLKLVHRDVSPPNVLLSYSGEIKLTDFGLASSTLKAERTAPGIIYGKVAYMSPEQARGERLDGRSDLYAAGIILWELLTGRQLFPPGKDQPQDLIQRASDPHIPAPSTRAPRVSAELDAICLRALAPRREDRFASGEEFREALAGWLARHAAGTDTARVASFVSQLFAEDIERERAERSALIGSVRAAGDSLRLVSSVRPGPGAAAAPGNAGPRRAGAGGGAAERSAEPVDRRRTPGRRADDGARAVRVPPPGPGGQTMLPRAARSGAASAALAPAFQAEPAEAREPELGEWIEDEDSSDVVGLVIDGRYRICELIGEGGMGRVYHAEHVEIGKRVALKILHPVYGRMPELVERFRREARAASRIGHPHIVDVTDSGTTVDGSVYFVMEYLEGVELASVIDREGALEIGRALRITTQMCRALAAAHAVGIIHRDLKPENIFLTIREGTSDFVKVLDFGIAKSSEGEEARSKRLTHPGMAMGTPEYMAPEQAAGKPSDARCDVYAVGAILYEMLTGVPPYEGANFMEILSKKATIDPVPVRRLRPEVPEPVERVVMNAMARDPQGRPRSMEALEYELTKCLSGRGAAVAKILGMSPEIAAVAPVDGEMAAVRPASGSTGPAEILAMLDGAAADGAPVAGVAPVSQPAPLPRSDSDADISATAELLPVANRRRLGVWLGLGGLLAAGAAALFLVIRPELAAPGQATAAHRAAAPGPDGPVPAPQAAIAAPAAPRPATAGAVTVPHAPASAPGPAAGAGGAELAGTAAGAPPVATTEPGVPTPAGGETAQAGGEAAAPEGDEGAPVLDAPPSGERRTVRRKRVVSGDRPPRSRQEAKLLLRQADARAAQLEWSDARAAYERVAAGRYLRDRALLGMARIAFETKDTAGAIAHAHKALRSGAGDRARILLGHAYYKQGNFARALEYYQAVLRANPRNEEARRAAEDARDRLGR
jgi:serine/threonine protein kinase